MRTFLDPPNTKLLACASEQERDQVLADFYQQVGAEQLAAAYSNLAKGLAFVEEHPRGTLGAALRRHFNVIVAEQQRRGEVLV